MKYFSIDIETTGLSPIKHQILEFAIQYEDTNDIRPIKQAPHASWIVDNGYELSGGSITAINMNKDILSILSEYHSLKFKKYYEGAEEYALTNHIVNIGALESMITNFIVDNIGKKTGVVFAGKNVSSFDIPFLRAHGLLDEISVHHRTLDPLLHYVDWAHDDCPPSLTTCLDRAKPASAPHKASHRALEDARMVIEALRPLYAKDLY